MGEMKLKKEIWTTVQDEMLLNTVLQHLREGKKQKRAFEEFAQRTGRTMAAVTLRFHSYLRKKYRAELSPINLRSDEKVILLKDSELLEDDNQEVDWEKALSLLNNQLCKYENLKKRIIFLHKQLAEVTEENAKIREENAEINEENVKIKEELEEFKVLNKLNSEGITVSSVLKILEHAQSLGMLDKTISAE